MTMQFTNYEKASNAKLPLHRKARFCFYRHTFKPWLDSLLIILAAPFILPVLAMTILLAMLDGGNPFYTQLRVGRGGRTFRLWKIRTMVPDADARLKAHLAANPAARAEWNATQKLKDDPRITRIGRILRKTSMDELPQLFNVLAGTMSLVGPRPIMVEQKLLYTGRTYFDLDPGITGLWQIADRNKCDFIDRVRYDDTYGQTISLITDLRILFKTVAVVLRGTGC